MAAYGLYTHIAANKTRSMLLLGGLFVLVYVMVYAGALIAEVMTLGGGAPADYYLTAAAADLIKAFPFATGGALLWGRCFGGSAPRRGRFASRHARLTFPA